MTLASSDRLLQIRQRFLVGLERRLTDLTTTLNGSADPASLMPMFHSLTGIGGTFGFHRISEISRLCESLCVNVTREQRGLTFIDKELLGRALVEIRSSAALQSGTLPVAA
jgi:chemotaxis protein histidine kinase CheA